MSTFYDCRNRQYTLIVVDHCFTHLHSLSDNATLRVANFLFKVIFNNTPNEKVPEKRALPIVYLTELSSHDNITSEDKK